MEESSAGKQVEKKPAFWRSFGPALITACAVMGPGSMLVCSNVGAKHGYELLWLLILTGVLMGTFISMAMRIAVMGGATPLTIISKQLGRPLASVIGINLCLIGGTFQFSNNLALATALKNIFPVLKPDWILLGVNGLMIIFVLTSSSIYRVIERTIKFMVGIMLVCFILNLVCAAPSISGILKGFVPHLPEGLTLSLPEKVDGVIIDPMILVASLIGTTFSVGGAFFQGNLVRERRWTVKDYKTGIGDSIAGVSVLALISSVIMITTATVIPGRQADNIGTLAESLRPLMGNVAHIAFSLGLLCVSLNPFVINAMSGGVIISDGLGKPAGFNDKYPRRLTVLVLLVGMLVAMLILHTPLKPINAIIFGQALTVLCNPLVALSLMWMANNKKIMGDRTNNWVINLIGSVGVVVVIFAAFRVFYTLILRLS